MSQTQSILKFVVQSVIAGLAVGFLIVYFRPNILKNKVIDDTIASSNSPYSYASAVKKIAPSVVSIYAQSEVVKNHRIPPVMQKFMGLKSLVPQTITQQYLGSGVVMSADGYIVTNNHVINNATKIIVSLWDNSLLEAKLIGSDSDTDIAVLKVEALNLTPATFADSDLTETGDIVMAIGNPYGLSQSVTLGIISAKGRSGLAVSTIEDFIQTDAAINEGNSGGALINARGNVVGISTANFNQNGAQGINFAIPSNATKLIMQEILKNGKVSRGWLGVELFTQRMLYNKRLIKPKQGEVIWGLHPNSPAKQSGLKKYDIVTHIDDVEIVNRRHYLEIIARTKPGENLEVSGLSENGPFSKKITTIERPTPRR